MWDPVLGMFRRRFDKVGNIFIFQKDGYLRKQQKRGLRRVCRSWKGSNKEFKFNLVGWKETCKPIFSWGGVGFKDLDNLNQALLWIRKHVY